MTHIRHRLRFCQWSRSNRYDHLDRCVQKITPAATHTYFYDGWLLIKEIVANTNGTTDVIEYHWGKDLSGTIGGAGGVGGLLYLSISNSSTPNSSTTQLYVPWYDAYGNVMGYWDAQGNVVAEYTYDAFGKLISSSGPMADVFSFRYSTKYYDSETGLYYYGYRFYSPELMRWLTRDPIGEEGGVNLYAMCENNVLCEFDVLGENRYITHFDILNYGGSGGTQIHVGVAVDKWECKNGRWTKVGAATFDFAPKPTVLNVLSSIIVAKGWIRERNGLWLKAPITFKSTPEQDVEMLKIIRKEAKNPPFYNPIFFNCVFWSVGAVNYGMDK